MKRLRAKDFENKIWESGSAAVKKCLRKMREYAKIDFEIPDNEIEEVVKDAMGMCTNIENDELVHNAVDLALLWTGERWERIRSLTFFKNSPFS